MFLVLSTSFISLCQDCICLVEGRIVTTIIYIISISILSNTYCRTDKMMSCGDQQATGDLTMSIIKEEEGTATIFRPWEEKMKQAIVKLPHCTFMGITRCQPAGDKGSNNNNNSGSNGSFVDQVLVDDDLNNGIASCHAEYCEPLGEQVLFLWGQEGEQIADEIENCPLSPGWTEPLHLLDEIINRTLVRVYTPVAQSLADKICDVFEPDIVDETGSGNDLNLFERNRLPGVGKRGRGARGGRRRGLLAGGEVWITAASLPSGYRRHPREAGIRPCFVALKRPRKWNMFM